MKKNLDEHEQKAVDNIEEYGCHVMHIFAEDDLPTGKGVEAILKVFRK